jgi:hypothetical protein
MMEAHPEGLALLRSAALADRPLRTAAIVGQARTGKSYFMNSVFGRRQTFPVASSQDGVTLGLWLSHLPDDDCAAAVEPGGHAPRLPAPGCAGGAGQPATLLLDTEGLGAPGGDDADYGSKLVALAAMLSSVTFYNSMRTVNQMEIGFLGDVVLFDEVFRNKTRLPLMGSRLVWLVQNYGLSEPCEDYPDRFLGASRNAAHDRIVSYVRSRAANSSIYCLPHPQRRVPDQDLSGLAWAQLDAGYRAQIEEVRGFLAGVPPKAGVRGEAMTGAEMATLVEHVVPQLNNIHGAASRG